MRILVFAAALCLPACSLLGSHTQAIPEPTELVITGAAAGSIVAVDGVAAGRPATLDERTQIFRVAPGSHTVEVRVDDSTVYREETYVSRGEHQIVRVLSGSSR